MMKKIYKHTIQVVILSEDESLEKALGSDEWDLSAIEAAISDGDCIGTYSHEETQQVPATEIEIELIAIGNDGTFFDNLDGCDED
jgi:hypothetical protein